MYFKKALKTISVLTLCFVCIMSIAVPSAFAFSYENGTNVPVTDILIEAEDFESFVDTTPTALDSARVALTDAYPYVEALNYSGATGKAAVVEMGTDAGESFTYNVEVPVAGFYRVLLEIRESISGKVKVYTNGDAANGVTTASSLTPYNTNWKNNPLPYSNAGLLYFDEGANTVTIECATGLISYGSFRVVSPEINVVQTANMGEINLGVDGLVRATGASSAYNGDFFGTDNRATLGQLALYNPVGDPNYGAWIKWSFNAPVDGDYTFNLNGKGSENISNTETGEYFTTPALPGYDGAFKAHIAIDGDDKASVGSAGNYVSNLGTYTLTAGDHTIIFKNDSFAYYYVSGMDISYVEKNSMSLPVKGAVRVRNSAEKPETEITTDTWNWNNFPTADTNWGGGSYIKWTNVTAPVDGSYTFTLKRTSGYFNPGVSTPIGNTTYYGNEYAGHLVIDGTAYPTARTTDSTVKEIELLTIELTAGSTHTIEFWCDCCANMTISGIDVAISVSETPVYALEAGKTYKAVVDLDNYCAGITNLNDNTGNTDTDIPWTADEFDKVTVIAAVYTGDVLTKAYMGSTMVDNVVEVPGIQIANGQTVKVFVWDMANVKALTDFVVY